MIDIKSLTRDDLEGVIRSVMEYNSIDAGEMAFLDANGQPLALSEVRIACTSRPIAVRVRPEQEKTLEERAAAFSRMPIGDPFNPSSLLEIAEAIKDE